MMLVANLIFSMVADTILKVKAFGTCLIEITSKYFELLAIDNA